MTARVVDETGTLRMSGQELQDIEKRLEQGECRADDMRRLIHAVRSLSDQLDSIQRVLAGIAGKR